MKIATAKVAVFNDLNKSTLLIMHIGGAVLDERTIHLTIIDGTGEKAGMFYLIYGEEEKAIFDYTRLLRFMKRRVLPICPMKQSEL